MGSPSAGQRLSRPIIALISALALILTPLVTPAALAAQSDTDGLRMEIDETAVGNWNISDETSTPAVNLAQGQMVKIHLWNFLTDNHQVDLSANPTIQWTINGQEIPVYTYNETRAAYTTNQNRDIDCGEAIGIDSVSSTTLNLIALREGEATLSATMTRDTVSQTASAKFVIHPARIKIIRQKDNVTLTGTKETDSTPVVTELTGGENVTLAYYITFDGDGTTITGDNANDNQVYSYQYTTSQWGTGSYETKEDDNKTTKHYAAGWRTSSENIADFNGSRWNNDGNTTPLLTQQVTVRTNNYNGRVIGDETLPDTTAISLGCLFIFRHRTDSGKTDRDGNPVYETITESRGEITAQTTLTIEKPTIQVHYGPDSSTKTVNDGDTLPLTKGENVTLTSTFSPTHSEYATTQTTHWTSNNQNVATVSGTTTHTVTAVNTGTSDIIITMSGTSFTMPVTVEEPTLSLTYQGDLAEPVDATGGVMELTAGETATLTLGFAQRHDYTSLDAMTWTSDDTSVATVTATTKTTSTGENPVTQVTALKAGDTTITGTIAGHTVSLTVHVVGPTLRIFRDDNLTRNDVSDDDKKREATDQTIEVTAGEQLTLYTQIAPTHAWATFKTNLTSTTWAENSTQTIVKLPSSARGNSTTLTAVSTDGKDSATATVTASLAGQSATVTISVIKPTVTLAQTTGSGSDKKTEDVTGKELTLRRDTRLELEASVSPLHADYATVQKNIVRWTTDDSAVASLSSSEMSGTVTARKEGRATIAATVDDAAASVDVTVVTPTRKITISGEGVAGNVVDVVAGESLDLTALTDPDGAPVTWTSADSSIASVSATGTVTGVTAGRVRITAESYGTTASVTVNVLAAADDITISGDQVSGGALTLLTGQKAQLTATTEPTGMPVTWSSSDETVAIIDAKTGEVTSLKAGETTITAATRGKKATIELTVLLAATSLTIPSTRDNGVIYAYPDDTVQLTATTTPQGLPVTWNSSDTSIAAIDENGLVTAFRTGTTTITASSRGESTSVMLTVRTRVNSLTITGATDGETSVPVGKTLTLSAVSDPDGVNVTWSSSDTSVASVSASGVVRGRKEGEVTITVTANDKSASVTITVVAAVSSITISGDDVEASELTLVAGHTSRLTAQTTPEGVPVEWLSSDDTVATVDETGVVTGVAEGRTTVVAQARGTQTLITVVVVAPVTSLEISGDGIADGTLTMFRGGRLVLTAAVSPASAPVALSSSDSSVISVTTTGIVTAAGTGTATVTASSRGTSTSVQVTVVEPVTGITFYYDNSAVESMTIIAGQSVTLTAQTQPESTAVTWSSTDTSVATVDAASGVVNGLKAGRTTIIASARGVDRSLDLTVEEPVKSITISGDGVADGTAEIVRGKRLKLTARVVPSGVSVEWTSSDTSVALVSASGEVSTVTTGTATITASARGTSKSIVVVVVPPTTAITITPSQGSLYVGQSVTLNAISVPTTAPITWTADDTVSLSVSNNGHSVTVTGVTAGTATVEAHSRGFDTSVSLTVESGVAIYRLYNPASGEHHYTQSTNERDYLVTVGWNNEGVGWVAPYTSSVPVYRVYNSNTGDHHYTRDLTEYHYLTANGWSDESENGSKPAFYSAEATSDGKQPDAGAVPLWRQYNPNATGAGSHNYTTKNQEKTYLLRLGWKDEGVSWYAVEAAS